MSLILSTPAATPAVSLAEGKLHLRVDIADDDALITALIASATDEAEHFMGRAIMPQKWTLTLDCFFSDGIELARPVVTAIDSVKYIHPTTGVLTTMPPGDYQAVLASEYVAYVTPAWGKAWPESRAQAEAVQIIFSCGYASAVVVPEPIKSWIKLRLGTLYENREEVLAGNKVVMVPGIDRLLDRYRVWRM